MKVLSVFLALCFVAGHAVGQKMVGCYVASWHDIASKINPKLCTHAYYAFLRIDAKGGVSDKDKKIASFKNLKKVNPNIKLLVSIGGGAEGVNAIFSTIAKSDKLIATLVSNCLNYVNANGLDGIDIDWEYPLADDKDAYVKLLAKFKLEFKKNTRNPKLVTIASPAGSFIINRGYKIKDVCSHIYFNNVMSYDAIWPRDYTGHNAGMSFVKLAVDIWSKGGCPKSKIVLGLPMYGIKMTLKNPKVNGLNAAASGYGTISYRDLCPLIKPGWTVKRDAVEQVPYAYSNSQWITYDDPTSLIHKTSFAKNSGLAGVFNWATYHEDYNNNCKNGAFPLMTTIARNMGLIR